MSHPHPLADGKPRPALRLIKTGGLSRDDWLSVRKQGIGSSDAAAALGLNPYQSPLELWLIKTHRDSGLPVIDPNDETSPMYWGNLLEPVVASHYTRRTGHKVRRINAVLQHPDPDKAWMLANLDREVLGSEEVQILECKTAGINGAKLWKDGVPEYIQIQVQHQLAVSGKAAADVAVLLGGQELRIHRVQRDELLITRLIVLERRFWHYVETDTPPPADGSDSAETALRCLYPEDTGAVCDFRAHRNLSATFADLQTVREQIAQRSALEAQLKQRLQEAMGSASLAHFETGSVSWKRSQDGSHFDLARFEQDHPDLVAHYRMSKPGSRRFLVL